jgi:hypothetical protein
VTEPAERRRILPFWTGTRPGLERMLLASVPALVIGLLVAKRTNGYVGYLVGIGILVLAVFVRRRRPAD